MLDARCRLESVPSPLGVADSDIHMRAVNDSLGYRPTHETFQYQLDL
ncbi:hypothetical protein [Streptosporangium sp. NPDC001681]